MMMLFGVVTATLAVAATDIGRAHDAGGAPVLLVILGTTSGVIIHEILALEPPWAFVSLLALPIGLGLAGLAVGVALSADGRPRRFAIAGLAAGALALAGGAYWMHPTPEALHVRALIRTAHHDEQQREVAIEELGEIDHPGAMRVLIRALADDDPEIVAAAATALGRSATGGRSGPSRSCWMGRIRVCNGWLGTR